MLPVRYTSMKFVECYICFSRLGHSDDGTVRNGGERAPTCQFGEEKSRQFREEKSMRIQSFLLGGACFGASMLMPLVAEARSSPDLDKIDRLQRQMEQLREQLKSLKREMVQAKKKSR